MGGPSRIPVDALPARLRTYVGREAGLALLVLAATAVLVDSAPPRHAGHAGPSAPAVPGPFRLTMEELHASGGVPKGWTFVPPAGDAARGRGVFVRLGCFECHRIPEAKLPAPARPGPDLAGVGEHHPAGYILESILNPNAVVVEGPGYTGQDGGSIMPDYRDRLSVGELLDLVAYLEAA